MSDEPQGYGNQLPMRQEELTVQEVLSQVKKVQEIMAEAMKQDVHYGTIPGTDKPTLLQPGAQKLALTFRLGFENKVEPVELEKGHREYRSETTVFHIPTGRRLGVVCASCSTIESKYRYRWENTTREVPKEYWQSRNAGLLGGEQFVARKQKGDWLIFHRVAYDNPADYYNTCEKMAQKRSEVKAVLNVTAASDIFSQDLEDLADNGALDTEEKENQKTAIICPKCGQAKSVIRNQYAQSPTALFCFRKKGGCGHTWDPAKETESAMDRIESAKPSEEARGLYQLTPTHRLLSQLVTEQCDGDMIRMGDMVESLTAWTDTRKNEHPGKREVSSISESMAERAVEKFQEQFGTKKVAT